jgi:hypothetical protein
MRALSEWCSAFKMDHFLYRHTVGGIAADLLGGELFVLGTPHQESLT